MQFFFKLFTLLGVLIFYAQCDTPETSTVSVVTLLYYPYTMIRDVADNAILVGNERYEGFLVDLIDAIAKKLDFKYDMVVVEDGRYGSFRNGEWDGLIGEVQSGRAMIGAAPMTITSERETAVDFTLPFMSLGISILYKRAPAGEAISFWNAEELAALNTTINFGCIRGGSTQAFFAQSKNPTYKRLYERMLSAEPSSFTNSYSEGIERVKKGDYAFFMESSTIEYYVEQNCDLVQVGGLLDSKGFGLIVREGSPMREKLSQAILQMQETGDLAALKRKWWKNKNSEKCDY